MSAVTSELQRVAKNLNVGTGKSSYRAVGEADILDAVKPVEVTNGIYSYPVSRNIIDSGTIENESVDWNTKEKLKKSQLFMRVETIYRFVNMDNPSEFVEITTYGDGVDSQDKAPGKAMTYADKYALMKAYKISTGDDPDQNASEDLKKVNTQKQGNKSAESEPPGDDVQAIRNKAIDRIQLGALESEIKRTGANTGQICKLCKISYLSELSFENWDKLMKRLEKVPTKQKTDLGLQEEIWKIEYGRRIQVPLDSKELHHTTGITVEEASTKLVTGCPHCNRSYCD